MTNREALRKLCSDCEKLGGKLQMACPFRSISNEFCNEYEQVEKALKKLEYIESIEKKHTISAVAYMTLIDEDLTKKKEKNNGEHN